MNQIPEPIEPESSPLLPKNLINLFIRPVKFFSSQIALGKRPYVFFVTWCYGAVLCIDRLDQGLLRAYLGRPKPGWETFGPFLVGSWLNFWVFVLAAGALSGLLIWYLGGLWYRIRLGLSGHVQPDKRLTRLVYIYSSFVAAIPVLIVTTVQTLIHNNFHEAWLSETRWSNIILVFPFWSCVVSYKGAVTVFQLQHKKALAWFLILPFIFYFLALGLVYTSAAQFF